ncbi:MAG: hypothetical protein KTR35_20035 [Gammaproteobacteria bacterium]|nr:hypothetical protein [Gammaproteobacteria bacterium]
MDSQDAQSLINILTQFYADYAVDCTDTKGLDLYAFSNRQEFRAEISQYFLSGEIGATIVNNASPELYDILSRFYGINYENIS